MLFNVYVFFLIASGVMMLVMGGIRAPYARRSRTANLVIGAGFTIYGLYLLLFLQSGHYIVFFYAFALPVLLVVRFFRARAAYRAAQASQAAPVGVATPSGYGNAPSQYGQPSSYGQSWQ